MTSMHGPGRRPTTLERAFELARSGECASLNEIKHRLEAERYDNIRGQLFGPRLKLDLQHLCNAARAAAPEPPGRKRPMAEASN